MFPKPADLLEQGLAGGETLTSLRAPLTRSAGARATTVQPGLRGLETSMRWFVVTTAPGRSSREDPCQLTRRVCPVTSMNHSYGNASEGPSGLFACADVRGDVAQSAYIPSLRRPGLFAI